MLKLTRRIGEAIVIDGNIRIVFVERKSAGQISIGIEAPREITIVREELLERSKQEETRK